ncbi:MAG: hypothetical protein RJA22_857 [Verrucomicrobiota bacterium]|jgi:signal transduction histidine kinase
MDAPLELVLQHWPGVLFRQGPDGGFTQVGARVEEWTGHPAAAWLARPGLLGECVHEADADAVERLSRPEAVTAAGVTTRFRLRHATTGRVTYVTEFRRAAAGGGTEGYWMDETRLAVAERRLAAAAWKETLALLTTGLAHDFNNILAGVHALSESFLEQLDTAHPFHEGLTLMKRNTQSASQLVQRIIQLHHVRTGQRAYHDLNAAAGEAGELVRKVIPRRIEFSTRLAGEALPVYADAVELQQVLINLALNAADAMSERGTLQFRTAAHAAAPAAAAGGVGTPPAGPCVSLAVEDTGCGIAPRHLRTIFEPFFTTKPMNKGSGLGLYNARLFAEKHGGALTVESTEGRGTTFTLWLPQADFTEADQARERAGRRRRSLLLAGPPGAALAATAQFLRQQGFHVAATSAEAGEMLASGDHHFDGLYLLLEPRDSQFLPVVQQVRKQALPLRVIVQTVGCNQDELDARLLAEADLAIDADLPQETILEKLTATLGLNPA